MANWKSVVLAAVLTALTACTSTATGPEPLPDDDGAATFVVTTHDAQTLDAELTSSLGSIHVLANVSGPDVIDVTFDFGDPVIAYRIDRGRGRGDFMPSGGALDTVDVRGAGLVVVGLVAAIDLRGATDDRYAEVIR